MESILDAYIRIKDILKRYFIICIYCINVENEINILEIKINLIIYVRYMKLINLNY